MRSRTKLSIVRIIHTLIWLSFNAVIFYALFAVAANRLDDRLYISLGLIAIEAIVLLLFKMSCPLTLLARRYSSSLKANFDIFLPGWLAKYNKPIYSSIVLISLIILTG